jgi:HPt (histidine-containing phosphotransfer) domain-containing protein
MDGQHRRIPLPGGRLPHDASGLHAVEDGFTFTASADPSRLTSRLASELFARLLLELPGHRHELQSAGRDGDTERLVRAAHKLLGAVVYCALPELAEALRELKRMSGPENTAQTAGALNKVVQLIDELLACSGYRDT